MGVCMRGGESDRDPPAVVAIVCVVAGERERERGGGEGGGGRESNNPSSKPLDKHSIVKTTRQAQHTNRSTLEAGRYDSSIHPKRLLE